MITHDQIKEFAKSKNTNETTVFREYIQLLFLSRLYAFSESGKIFFKGGTALHLIFDAPRFSEDLDFTVNLRKLEFKKLIVKVFDKFTREEEVSFKKKKSVAGETYLLTVEPKVLPYKVFVSLDFSFRETVLDPQKSMLTSDYPVLFDSYVYHLSKEEILAEKIRAVLTRKKGRDWYDLWFLLSRGVKLDNDLVKKKLKYYKLKYKFNKEILSQLDDISLKDFVLDMRPFLPIVEREKLPKLHEYIKDFLTEKLRSSTS